jgi:hypothetical protein
VALSVVRTTDAAWAPPIPITAVVVTVDKAKAAALPNVIVTEVAVVVAAGVTVNPAVPIALADMYAPGWPGFDSAATAEDAVVSDVSTDATVAFDEYA